MANAAAPSRPDLDKGGGILALEREAHGLADRLPDIVIEAQRIAQTVAHGIHGRRRSGPGETFWQFRQFEVSDTARQIDWRRSASSDQLYVREREWEAAHTVWLWPDLSPSMDFCSHLSHTTKRVRATVLMLAAAELLVRGGERVGFLGLTNPTAKNRLAKLALKDTTYEPITDLFKGPTCLAYSEDPIAAAKVSVTYAKGNDKLIILGGAMGATVLDANAVKALAELPSLDELRATLIGLLNAPATKIARTVKEPGAKLARVIQAKASQSEAA